MNGRLGITLTRFYKTQEIRYCRQVIDEGVNLWIKTYFSKFLCFVLCIMLYKVALFQSVYKTLVCGDHSNESY